MGFKVGKIGQFGLETLTPGGKSIAMKLEKGQTVPPEFRTGDRIRIACHPGHPIEKIMGTENSGYYDITHVATGTVLRVWHRAWV